MITTPILVALAVALAIVQVGAVPAAFAQPLAAPVLPIALLAGWSAIRRPREAWPVPVAAAIVLGAVSEARVGVFVLALLPALVIVTLVRLRERRGEGTALRRLALAAVAGGVGALCYVAFLSAADRNVVALTHAVPSLFIGMLWTGLLAMIVGAALWRVRTSSGGLFA